MYKKNLVKATSVLTAFALACSSMAGCGLTKKTEDTAQVQDVTTESPEAEELVETMTEAAFTGKREGGESGKEETVYVMTDANGAAQEVVVSNWLKNANGEKSLTDTTNLKDIVNVKGDEGFKDNGDGTVTWDAEGQDIYYQGTPTEEVPVGVKVTYELDGQQMTAEDIAGKSGNVKIRFDYTNSLTAKATIDGKEETIDVPFTMISGTMLDNEKFANVKVSNGKVISDANNYVVVGVAMPGLKESLKLDDEKLEENDIDDEDVDIPDFVEITADVQDFELPMTVSMASANVVSDLGLDKIYNSEKIDDLNGDMDELADASTQLRDGSGDLADGTDEFKDGTDKLYDGVGELKDGTGELKTGVGDLKDGAGQLKDGAGQLKDGTSQLKDGTGQLKDGAGQLASGSKDLASGATKLSDGIGTYADAVGKIAKGAKDLDDGVGTLKTGAGTLSSGISSAKDGAKSLSDGAATLKTGIDTAADGIKQQLAVLTAAQAAFEAEFGDVLLMSQNMNSSNTLNANVRNAAPSSDKETQKLIKKITDELANLYADDLLEETQKVQEAEKRAQEAEKRAEDAERRAEEAENALNDALNNPSNTSSDEQQTDTSADENKSEGNEDKASNEDNKQSTSDESQSGSDENASNENAEQPAENSDNAGQDASTQDAEQGETTENTGSEDSQQEESVTLGKDAVNPETVEGGVDEYAADAAGIAAICAATGMTADEIQALRTAADAAIAANSTDGQSQAAATQYAILDQAISNAEGQSDERKMEIYTNALSEIVTNVKTPTQTGTKTITTIVATYNSIVKSREAMQTLYGTDTKPGLKDIQTGAAQLAVGANSLYDGMKKLDQGGSSLSSGIGTLKDGTKKLSKGATELNSNSGTLKKGGKDLASGAGKLSDGASKLSDGTSTLDEGVGKLADGASQLYDGTDKLYDGTGKLYDGATELDNGVGKLKDGAGELKDGAGELSDGARKLADGMVEFDEEGIQKLTGTVNEDVVSMTDRLKAIDEASQSYKSFSGANDDEPSSVQFIIRTAPIKSDKD